MNNFGNRIIVLIDMDCFFCQVEAKLNPTLKGKAMAVVQYSTFGPGATIAVSYEAREFGVTKHMRGDEARKKCPHIELVTVPPVRNKPDTSRYRNAGKQVIEVLAKYCNIVERASVDEAYLDITDLVEKKFETMSDYSLDDIKNHLSSSFVVGHCDNDNNDEEKRREGIDKWVDETFDDLGDIQAQKLAIAGIIVEEFREAIYSQCEYRCSAGISYNKILAKLACGLHKPNRQTILPTAEVPTLYSLLPINKVRNLGGKFGNIVMESLSCNVMADLLRYSLNDLQKRFDEKTGSWLFNIARGIDNEPVQPRLIGKSIGSTKNFPGKQAITKLETLKYWIRELTTEIVDRLEQDLEENQRRATSLTISYHFVQDKKVIGQSRVCSLSSYKHEKIMTTCLNVITKATQKPISFVGMSASKFVPAKDTATFVNFFKAGTSKNHDSTRKSTSDEPKSSENQEMNSINGNSNHNDVAKNPIEEVVKIYTEKNDKSNDKIIKDCDETFVPNTSMKKPSSLLSNTDIRETFNGENLKNSFFMNILKDSKNSMDVIDSKNTLIVEGEKHSMEKYIYKIKDNISESLENNSPDLFDDLESHGCTGEDTNDKQIIKTDGNEAFANTESGALVKLQELFPDLDNIDLSIVQLLPIELQREANIYLKSKKSLEMSTTTKSLKENFSTKIKPIKNNKTRLAISTKSVNNFMKNFVVKNTTDNNELSFMKRCSNCDQMIKIEKFAEHLDFHVAQNLQKDINRSLNDCIESSLKRDSDNEITSKTVKKKKSIDSYFVK